MRARFMGCPGFLCHVTNANPLLQAGSGLGALSSLESKLAQAAAAAEDAAAGALGAGMIPAVRSQMGVEA